MPRLSPYEWSYAQAGAFVTRHESFREQFHGPAHPRTTLLDFHVARTTRGNVELMKMEGHDLVPGAGQASWPVHVLAVDGMTIAITLRRGQGETLGYAWNTRALGRAVLVAEIPEDDLPEPGDPFAGGVSVGAETTNGGLVVVRPDRTLVSLGQPQTPDAAGLHHLQPVYELPDFVPDDIPLY